LGKVPQPQDKAVQNIHEADAQLISNRAPHFFEMVTFKIIKNCRETAIPVHKAVACSCSPVFNAAFSGEFIEGQVGIYTIEDTELTVFKVLTEYMYNRDIPAPSSTNDKVVDHQLMSEETMALLKLWVLADRYFITHLQNLVMAALMAIFRKYEMMYKEWLDYVYAATSEGSALRRLFIKAGLLIGAESMERNPEEWFPAGYLMALMREILRHTEGRIRGIDFSDCMVPEI